MEIQPTQSAGAPTATREDQLMAVAQSLEAAFLSEMLKSAGIGETPEEFGGGAG
jgi:flagellar protein FlgJ